MHIPDRDRCNWLRERIETPEQPQWPRDKKLHTLDRLAWSEMFEVGHRCTSVGCGVAKDALDQE